MFYKRPIGKNAEIGAYLLHQDSPSHSTDGRSQTTAFGMVRATF